MIFFFQFAHLFLLVCGVLLVLIFLGRFCFGEELESESGMAQLSILLGVEDTRHN